jgi:salicylate hydroxylase
LEKQFGSAIAVLHRANLIGILLKAADGGWIHLGHELTAFTQDVSGVSAQFANNQVAKADVLIGADGLHSAVRAHLFNDGSPRYSGYTAWRPAKAGDLADALALSP